MRRFNVTGLCTPDKDYMVDISDKIEQIRAMVDMEEYFTINRARQYGKTTTLPGTLLRILMLICHFPLMKSSLCLRNTRQTTILEWMFLMRPPGSGTIPADTLFL